MRIAGNVVVAALNCLAALDPAGTAPAESPQRPALADHVGSLPAIEVVDLGYAAARTAGHLIADGLDWQACQAVDAARPSAEWPRGLPVVTALPDLYRPYGIAPIPL